MASQILLCKPDEIRIRAAGSAHYASCCRILVVFGLMVWQAICLAWIASVNAPVFDEVPHLAAGISHWKFGRFELYRVNPPLIRMLATIPLMWREPQCDWSGAADGPFERPEVTYGLRFLNENGVASFNSFKIARWALIPVVLLGGWICFCWSHDLFGSPCDVVALAMWVFCPTVLGWGATITPDLGAATFGIMSCYAFWRWLDSPSWGRSFAGGVALGLAELAKSTWIILFAVWPVIWIGWKLSLRSRPEKPPACSQLISILFLGLYLLNMGYGFEGSFTPLGEFHFVSETLSGRKGAEFPGNRFRGTLAEGFRIPLPRNYVMGIDSQKREFEDGKTSYLCGVHKRGGWYHYYLYAFLVKTPAGTCSIILMSTLLFICHPRYRLDVKNELAVLLPAIAVVVLVSSQTGFNRYFRYAIPAVPFLFIAASRMASSIATKRLVPITVAFLIATAVESISTVPHSLSFFNVLAGGPRAGHKHLLDANIDWGQDLLELKRQVDQRPELQSLKLAYFGIVNPNLTGFPFQKIEAPDAGRPEQPFVPGWYAISVHLLFNDAKLNGEDTDLSWFSQFQPDGTAGYSIYLFHVDLEPTCEQ